jgi:multidrug resistance efflux pump
MRAQFGLNSNDFRGSRNCPCRNPSQWLILILVGLIFTGCSTQTNAMPTATPTLKSGAIAQTVAASITANGVLLPYRQVRLVSDVGGLVESIPVVIGARTRAGETLVSLDSSEAQVSLQLAQTRLAAAQANYNLTAASLPAEHQAAVAAASLELTAAQQALDAIYKNADMVAAQALQALVAAEKEVADAQHRLKSLQMDADQAYIDAAHANMILAKAQLEKAEKAFEPWKNKREDSLNRAVFQSKLAQAQQIYAAAVRNYNSLFAISDGNPIAQAEADLVLAKANLASAQDTYDRLKEGLDPIEVALAEFRVENARAQLDLATSANSTSEKLALAQADVDTAQLNLVLAQAKLDKMTITAPMDGVISAIQVSEGEWAVPGGVVIELLDTSNWLLETKNVGELQIGRVELGQQARARVNAFQNETLEGHVIAISPDAVVQQGDTTYTLVIQLESTELNLRPGMTARVEILLE